MARVKLTPAERMLVEVAVAEYQQAVEIATQRRQARLSKVVESHPEAKDGPYNFEMDGNDLYLTYPDEGPAQPKEEALKEPIPITVKRRKKNAPVPPVE